MQFLFFNFFHVIHNMYLKGTHWISWGKKGIAWMFHFQNDTQNFMLSQDTLRKIAKVFCFYAPLISRLPSRSYGWSTLWGTWKICFSPTQTIFLGKKWPKWPKFQRKKIKSKLPNFYDKFQQVAKNIERFWCIFFSFHI